MRPPRATAALAAAVTLLAGGCARGAPPEDGPTDEPVALAPAFPPEGAEGTVPPPAPSAAAAAATSAPPTSASPSGTGGTRPRPSAPSGGGAVPVDGVPGGPAGASTTSAAIEDREFDTTPSVLDPAPAWSDLVAARLTRSAEGFELRVRLRGQAAPSTSGDPDHTMNVALFADVDGDGSIDAEVWLNVSSTGWGASYFDDTGGGRSGFQEGSGVTVRPEGTEVVATFPLAHLAGAERFRWSIASEWGRYAVVGTTAAARDDLPDDDGAAPFPGA